MCKSWIKRHHTVGTKEGLEVHYPAMLEMIENCVEVLALFGGIVFVIYLFHSLFHYSDISRIIEIEKDRRDSIAAIRTEAKEAAVKAKIARIDFEKEHSDTIRDQQDRLQFKIDGLEAEVAILKRECMNHRLSNIKLTSDLTNAQLLVEQLKGENKTNEVRHTSTVATLNLENGSLRRMLIQQQMNHEVELDVIEQRFATLAGSTFPKSKGLGKHGMGQAEKEGNNDGVVNKEIVEGQIKCPKGGPGTTVL